MATPSAVPQAPQATGLQASQNQWAQQYMGSVKQGNQDPNNLNRYLDYQYLLPGAKNTNMINGQGANLQAAQKNFMQQYGQAVQSGTNNLSQLGQYQGYLKAFGGQAAAPNQKAMQQLSIGALNGDVGAQNYLNSMKLKPMSGADLWNGYDPSQLKTQTGAWSQYMKDNPYSQTAKTDDMFKYAQYNNAMKTGAGLDGNEMNQYSNILSKWNLTDMTDPYNQNMAQIQQDKTDAIKGQDVALNQTMQGLDAKNFQNMQAQTQVMNNRGLGDSGLALDAYQRATMAANQDYSKAFADAANQKASIADKYDQEIATQQDTRQKQIDTVNQNNAQNLLAQEKENNAQSQFQQTEQDKTDQFLTAQTGTVYMGGRQITQNGKPITTLDWAKMNETQRHDIATENLTSQGQQNTYNLGLINANNTAQKNANDYNMGTQKNNITWNLGVMDNNTKYNLGVAANNNQAAKIANDFQIAYGNLGVAIQKQNLSAQEASANIENAKGKLAIASQNASTAADKQKADALGKALDVVNSQINAYQKANPGQPVPQEYKDTLGQIMNQMTSVNFQSGLEGVVPQTGSGQAMLGQ